MSYITDHQLTITVQDDHYRAEFDGKEVCVFDKNQGNHIAFMGSMSEAFEIAEIIVKLKKESNLTEVVKKETV